MEDRANNLRTLVVVAFCCLSLAAVCSSAAWTRVGAQRRSTPRPRRTSATRQTSAPRPPARMSFAHGRREHQLACDKCHQFPSPDWKEACEGGAAFPDVTRQPEHASCLSCHRQQFFARERPAPRICSVCHVAVSPRDQARLPFPNPPESFNKTRQAADFVSDFRVSFPHDKHLEVVGGLMPEARGVRFVTASYNAARAAAQESDPKSCAVCHQTYQPQGKSKEEYATTQPADIGERFWLKKGTFKTVPNHATCFTCHSQESGIAPAPNECNVCHKLAPATSPGAHADFDAALASSMGISDDTILQRWRRRESAGAFRHEGGAHPDLSCTTCHNTGAMNTLDPKTARVSVESCSTCHATATSEEGGALNAEMDRRKADPSFRCTKCHVTYGGEPVPGTHTKAVAAAGTD